MKFEDIEKGTWFAVRTDDDIYIKTKSAVMLKAKNKTSDYLYYKHQINCVSLLTGCNHYFKDEKEVIKKKKNSAVCFNYFHLE